VGLAVPVAVAVGRVAVGAVVAVSAMAGAGEAVGDGVGVAEQAVRAITATRPNKPVSRRNP